MSGLVGISLWVALATVLPGLVTLAVLYLSLAVAGTTLPVPGSDWVVAGLVVMVMVLTQALGILLEELLVRFELLGGRALRVRLPGAAPGAMRFAGAMGSTGMQDPSGVVGPAGAMALSEPTAPSGAGGSSGRADAPGTLERIIDPYELYAGLYVITAGLGDKDDAQGHLKRALAQFFLTNNTLVSFGLGVILCLALALGAEPGGSVGLLALAGGFLAALVVSYAVAVIRFREMAKSLWAVLARGEGSP